MANNKKSGSSPSSSSGYLNEFFGTKQHPDSPDSVLAIFKPKSSASRTKPANSVLTGHMPTYPGGSQDWNPKQENLPRDSKATKHPCPLSSSIYYGSQEDMYVKSSGAHASASYPTFYKNENSLNGISTEDDGAATMKWWEGSLYY